MGTHLIQGYEVSHGCHTMADLKNVASRVHRATALRHWWRHKQSIALSSSFLLVASGSKVKGLGVAWVCPCGVKAVTMPMSAFTLEMGNVTGLTPNGHTLAPLSPATLDLTACDGKDDFHCTLKACLQHRHMLFSTCWI